MTDLKRIITEIHRRSLWQVLGIYAVSAWIIYEVILALYEGLGLPDWIPPTALILFLIGLPLVLATAFVQEGGPAVRFRDDPLLADLDSLDDSGVAPASPPSAGSPGAPGRAGGARTRARLFTWRRAITAGILAFAALGLAATGFMGMRSFGIGPAGTLVAKGMMEARDPILLADFANASGDSTLGRVVTDALRIDLLASPVIQVVDPSAVAEVLRRMEREPSEELTPSLAREAAIREGWKGVIEGELARVGSSYILTAQLVEAESGEVLAGFRESAADDAGLLAAIDALSASIRSRIGESLKSVRAGAPLERVTTSSLEALRKYSQAERVEEEGDPIRAAGLYEEAIELDPGFAMAHRKLGVALSNARVRRQRGLEAVVRAYELRDRLNARERGHATAFYHMNATGDLPQVIVAYRNLLDRYPDDSAARNNLALAYIRSRDYAAAEALLEPGIEQSGGITHFTNLMDAQVAQGKVDEAWETWRLMAERFPTSAVVPGLRAALLLRGGDYEAADSLVAAEESSESTFARLQSKMVGAAMDATRGRVAEALAHIEELAEAVASLGLPAGALSTLTQAAVLQAQVLGDPGEARRVLAAALERYPLADMPPYDRPYLELALAFLVADAPDRAEELLNAYEATVPPEHRALDRHALEGGRGLIALARGDTDRALQLIQRVAREDPCAICALPYLGIVHERGARPDSAIAAYTRYLETPSLFDRPMVDPAFRGFVLERLAELHGTAGDRAAAARYYAELVELWQDADPELQPRVRSAGRALERLAAEGGAR